MSRLMENKKEPQENLMDTLRSYFGSQDPRKKKEKTNSRMRNLSRFGWMIPDWWRTWMATRSITPGTTKVNS